MMKKRLSLVKNDSSEIYHENYLNEVRSCLRDYGITQNDIDVLMIKFENILKRDSSYVFHYDSQYWANYIAEASGLVTESVML